MFSSDISIRKIYCRLLFKLDDKYLFPDGYFKNENILYYFEKKETKKKFIIVNIKDSVHFKYIHDKENNYSLYKKYIDLSDQIDHSIKNFDYLIKNFNYKELSSNPIRLKEVRFKLKKYYLINDGLHRLSILFNQNKKLKKDLYTLN